MYLEAGEIVDNTFHRMGTTQLGLDAEQFAVNTSPEDGKLWTVTQYGCDSITAVHNFGHEIPSGPRRWTGGVHHIARVEINGGWLERIFAVAGSGVQGEFDHTVASTIAVTMGSFWALREKALAGMNES